MTKIYLVKATYYVNGTFYNLVSEVFTNRKLAEAYCEFRKTLPSPKWIHENDYREYEIEVKEICKLDFSYKKH